MIENDAALDLSLSLDQQLCFALYSASRLMTRLYRPHLEKLGLTYPQYLGMLALWETDRRGETATVAGLGERLMLDSGTLSPLLKRLEAAGLVTRRRSSADERIVEIHLTDAGREMRAKAVEVPIGILCETQTPLDEVIELRERVRSLVERIRPVAEAHGSAE